MNPADANFAVFDFGPQMVMSKARYRDEERRNKLTYNFNSDPRLKRGHNYGVVYVSNVEEEQVTNKIKKKAKMSVTSSYEKKIKALESDMPKPPPNRFHLAVNTSPVMSKVRPKPFTLETEVQTDKYIDIPQKVLPWPQQTGIEKMTQIEDGDLFCFDTEVEPLLSVLMSKILEQSRMEVLEEEEIKELKLQQRYFEEQRNKELVEVDALEDAENRRKQEISNRKKQQEEINKITKTQQKKLYSRVFAKSYLNNLETNTLNHLKERNFFSNSNDNQYYTNLSSFIFNKCENMIKDDYVVVNQLNDYLTSEYNNQMIKLHHDSIRNEKIRKEELLKNIKVQQELRLQEKKRKKEEMIRIKKENELKLLKQSIDDELIKQVELIDDINDINVYEINGYHQKNKKYASLLGGCIGQIAIVISYFKKSIPDYITEDKILKFVELFIPKNPNINIPYKVDDFDFLKTFDPNLNNIEDINKCDENIYNDIVNYLVANNNDEFLPHIYSEFNNIGYSDIEEIYKIILSTVLKYYRSSLNATEPTNFNEKIKFIQRESVIDENYIAICDIKVPSILKTKVDNTNSQPSNNKKSNNSKKGQQVVTSNKIIFESEYNEKIAILPSFSDKMKILYLNQLFEVSFRSNIIECFNKIAKIEEKDNIKKDFEDFYNETSIKLVNNYRSKINKEFIEFEIQVQLNDQNK